MRDKEIVNKIKELQRIQPQTEWKQALKSELLAHGNFRIQEEQLSYIRQFFLSLEASFSRLALKPAYISVLAGFLLLFGVSASAFVLSQKSLPGQTLYKLKIATEKAQVRLTLDKSNQVKKEVYFVSRRLEELNQLAKDQDKGKNEKMVLLVENFHKEISRVQKRLNKLKDEAEQGEEAVEAAKIVDEKTVEFESILNETSGKPGLSGEVKQKLVLAIEALDQANTQALGVIIEKQSPQDLNGEDLISRLEDKISRTEVKIENINEVITGNDLVQDEQGMILAVNQKIDQVRVILNQARAYLDNNDFKMALEKVTESKDLTREARETLVKGTEIVNDEIKEMDISAGEARVVEVENELGNSEEIKKSKNSEINFPISNNSSNTSTTSGQDKDKPTTIEPPAEPKTPDADFQGGLIKEEPEKPGEIRGLLWKSKK